MPCRQGVTNLISNELQGQWKDVLYAGCLWEGLLNEAALRQKNHESLRRKLGHHA